jgi:hypothetical protein
VRFPERATLGVSRVNSSLSSPLTSSDHLGRFRRDLLDGPAMGGDGEREGRGSGEEGEVVSEHASSNSGRGWVETMGEGGA